MENNTIRHDANSQQQHDGQSPVHPKEEQSHSDDQHLSSSGLFNTSGELTNISKKFSVPFDVPSQKPLVSIETLSPYLLIRHGFSQQNLQELEVFLQKPGWKWENATMEDADIFLNEDNFDAPLHALGVSQCLSQRNTLNHLRFHVVYVSPLRRAIQTAIYIFSAHPDRKHIKFILMPELSECLCSSGCFSPFTLSSTKQEMDKLAKSYDITLDYSLVEQLGKCWQVLTLQDDHIKESIMNRIKLEEQKKEEQDSQKEKHRNGKRCQEYHEIVLDELKNARSFLIENTPMLAKKAKAAKKILEQAYDEINRQQRSSEQLAHDSADKECKGNCGGNQKDKKIGVVSHGFLLQCLTSKRSDEKGYPQEGIFLQNAEAMLFGFNQ